MGTRFTCEIVLVGILILPSQAVPGSHVGATDSCALNRAGSNNTSFILADHTSANDFDLIPVSTFEQIRSTYNIFYGHTSHGSQIVTGLNMLESEVDLYDLPTLHEISDDLGHNGDTSWVPHTRAWLNDHPEYNVIMWSWCGGCSDNTEAGINTYLGAMSGLEADYPEVTFIYMTGHLDGTGPEGNLYQRNNQIRAFCTDSGKILFDFADIESYDPGGTYYPDDDDGCSWCADWCAVHDCPPCESCAHSQCFNCYRKGRAFWWMMASISGQTDSCCVGLTGNIDNDPSDAVDLGDLTKLIDYLFISFEPPECLEEANIDGDLLGTVDLSDLTILIDYLFISFTPPAECQ